MKPQVFVAMSFHGSYDRRFREVIQPAVENIVVDNTKLIASRVDTSKTGDSILTDIMDGVAHSRLVLADVSIMSKDPKTGYAYRNGNVMYEVGLALACRHPSEVLLIRHKSDENEQFLFDVSTIPHATINFDDASRARQDLHEKLVERLREQSFVNDARVQLAIAGLSREELEALRNAANYPPGTVWGKPNTGTIDFFDMASTPRLLDKHLIHLRGTFEEGYPAYEATPLGRVVALHTKSGLQQFIADKSGEPKPEAKDSPAT